MIYHDLPGSGGTGDTTWFGRLNAFEQAETKRQVEWKQIVLGRLPHGPLARTYKGQHHYYPHILPDGTMEDGLYDKTVPDYCSQHNIAIHSEARNLKSSQVCCFNVLYPLSIDLPLASRALTPILPGLATVSKIEFEFTGPLNATKWLGEPNNGQSGRNRTSIDAAVWWADIEGNKRLTLIEWKYTERSFGTCAGYEADSHNCNAITLSSIDGTCYLTRGRNRRNYWKLLAIAGIDPKTLEHVAGCPFRGPFYQILRQYLLAAYLRSSEQLNVDIISVGFKGNTSLLKVPPYLSSLGNTIIDAWNAVLAPNTPKLRHYHAEDIVAQLRAVQVPQALQLANYLDKRYGL